MTDFQILQNCDLKNVKYVNIWKQCTKNSPSGRCLPSVWLLWCPQSTCWLDSACPCETHRQRGPVPAAVCSGDLFMLQANSFEQKYTLEILDSYHTCNRSEEEEEVTSLSRVRLFATPWTVAYQAPPSMGFSRQEYWSGLPFKGMPFVRKTTFEEH